MCKQCSEPCYSWVICQKFRFNHETITIHAVAQQFNRLEQIALTRFAHVWVCLIWNARANNQSYQVLSLSLLDRTTRSSQHCCQLSVPLRFGLKCDAKAGASSTRPSMCMRMQNSFVWGWWQLEACQKLTWCSIVSRHHGTAVDGRKLLFCLNDFGYYHCLLWMVFGWSSCW